MTSLSKIFQSKPRPPKDKQGRGYKGWHAVLTPSEHSTDTWELMLTDSQDRTWRPAPNDRSLYGSETSVKKQARKILRREADKAIKKAAFAEKAAARTKIVL